MKSAFKLYLSLFLWLFLVLPSFCQDPVLDTNMWVSDVAASAITRIGNTIYVGGSFTRIGPNTGRGAIFSTQTNQLVNSQLKINGTVSVSAPDGSGGWYIAGNFSNVAGVSRNRLAHILPNYTLDPNWIPEANDEISAMVVEGNTVYLGGLFTQINGQTRNRIAAINGITGQLLPWNPNANSKVSSIKILRNRILVGGNFSIIGGQSRSRLAALDLITGQATGWAPSANGEVRSIDVNGDVVYFGGSFSMVNSQPRSKIASVDTNAGQVSSWNPNIDRDVFTIQYANNSLYIGGTFTMIGTQSRNRIAALDVVTGLPTSFNPDCNGDVNSLLFLNNTLYVGGNFSSIGNVALQGLASIDLTTETINNWNPNSNGVINTISVSGSGLFIGGTFTTLGGVTRNRVAALDATTGQPTAWNPNADSPVTVIYISGNKAYIGGEFTSIGGQSRNNLAAIDLATGQATNWNPNPNGIVRTIDVAGNNVYIGGQFSSVGGQIRSRIAALDATTGLPTTWNPVADNTVSVIVSKGATIYVSGAFSNIGGQIRNTIAALDSITGLATSWNPNPTTAGVNAIGVIGNVVYLGGTFSSIGGQSRSRIAAVSASTGLATNWNPGSAGNIFALVVKGNTIYAGGTFTTIGGQSRNRLAAIDATTGQVTSWNPNANGSIFALHVDDYAIHATGGFTNIGSISNRGFAVFNLPPCIPTPTITAGGPTTFCSGGSVTLTAPAGFNYLWSNNETTQSINVTTGGNYTVQIIDNGCTSSVSAATVVTVNNCGSTWVGGNSTDWNNAANWSNNQVPGATTDITVPAGTANSLNLTGSFMCRDITLASGAVINLGGNALMVKGNADLSGTINGTGGIISLNGTTAQTLTGNNADVYRLEVANPQGCTFTGSINITDGLYLKEGVINNNNGTFTLKSNPSGTAFLDNFSSGFTGSLTAGIKFERYSTGAYRHIGAPLAGQTISSLNVSCFLVRTFDEPSNSWMPISVNCELEEFDNLGGISFNAGSGANNPTTVTFNGFPVSGTVSFPIVRSTSVGGGPQTGWNSLYNPYASPIDWDIAKNLGTNGIITNRAVWVWNSNINNWATLTGLGIAANGASNIIAAGQGILVRRLTNGFSGNTFTLDNSCRLGLNTNHFLRSGNQTNNETIRFTLSNETQKDETVIHLTNLSSQELDENDAERPQSLSNTLELSTLSKSGEKLMVNATSASDLKEIPLSIKTPQAGTYTLNLTENLTNLNIQILDLKTGKLTQAENGLTITASENEEITSRYKLIFNDKKSDAVNSFTAWAINATDIQIASVNNNIANLEIFNALGQKMDFTSQANSEGQSVIKLNNPSAGVIFIRLGNTTERVVMGR